LRSASWPAGERVGVVTNVEGTATVARVALAGAQPLRFRDDVYLRDRITTGERSTVRVLLGGKATVTARERSVVTITEVPGVATVELGEGRISVAVSKAMMKPGEVIQIKTPNAVSAIRGTIVVAEVVRGATVSSTITVLRGLVDVTRLDGGRVLGPSVSVGALQSIQVTGANALSQPRTISPADTQRLKADFRSLPSVAPAAAKAPAAKHAMDLAKRDAEALSSNAAGALDAAAADRAGDDGRGSGKDKSSRRPDFAGNIGPRDATRVSGSTSGTIGLLNVSTGGTSGSSGSGGSGSLVSTTSGSLVNVGISSGRSGSSESSGSISSGPSKK
jgi:FecR protein